MFQVRCTKGGRENSIWASDHETRKAAMNRAFRMNQIAAEKDSETVYFAVEVDDDARE